MSEICGVEYRQVRMVLMCAIAETIKQVMYKRSRYLRSSVNDDRFFVDGVVSFPCTIELCHKSRLTTRGENCHNTINACVMRRSGSGNGRYIKMVGSR